MTESMSIAGRTIRVVGTSGGAERGRIGVGRIALVLTVALGPGAAFLFSPPASATGSELGEAIEGRGYTVLADGVGVTGWESSYHGAEMGDPRYATLPRFSDHDRVLFQGRTVPAPGGELAAVFDEGVLATRIEGGRLKVVVACGLDSRNWLPVESLGGALFGQGDLFLSVLLADDTEVLQGTEGPDRTGSSGGGEDRVRHYALLNDMHAGSPVGHEGWWDRARTFRYGKGPDPGDDHGSGRRRGIGVVGQLVEIREEDDVQTSGGIRGHRRGHSSPDGLDERVFARGGTPVGEGEIAFDRIIARQPLAGETGARITWYLTEWTIPLDALGRGARRVAFHIATTCGNDQIGGILNLASGADDDRGKVPAVKKQIH